MEIYRWIAPETNTITLCKSSPVYIECVLCEEYKRNRKSERAPIFMGKWRRIDNLWHADKNRTEILVMHTIITHQYLFFFLQIHAVVAQHTRELVEIVLFTLPFRHRVESTQTKYYNWYKLHDQMHLKYASNKYCFRRLCVDCIYHSLIAIECKSRTKYEFIREWNWCMSSCWRFTIYFHRISTLHSSMNRNLLCRLKKFEMPYIEILAALKTS